jgi:phosphate ABC transporter permease protein PstC
MAWASLAILGVIGATLLVQAAPAISQIGFGFFSSDWHPPSGEYGVFPMLYGSVVVMCIAMVIAVPIGLLCAIAISETRSVRLRGWLRSGLELLAGIPSIVYGLIGVAYLSVWVAEGFDLQTGRLIFTAGIILSVMVLPTFLSLAVDAIEGVPRAVRENARALGLYDYEVITQAVLPVAGKRLVGAGLLALGRALGETMAVMLVIGSIDRLPDPLWNILSSGQSLTSKLGREIGEAAYGSLHFGALITLGLMLVLITLALTVAATRLLRT